MKTYLCKQSSRQTKRDSCLGFCHEDLNSITSTNVVGICRLKTCGFFHCCNVPVVFLVSCSFSTACWIFSFKLFNVSFLCRAVVTKIVFPIIKVDVNPKGWKLPNIIVEWQISYQAAPYLNITQVTKMSWLAFSVQREQWEQYEPKCNSGIVCLTDDTPNQFLGEAMNQTQSL